MIKIFQEHSLQKKKSNCSWTTGNIVISLGSSRYVTTEVWEPDDQELCVSC